MNVAQVGDLPSQIQAYSVYGRHFALRHLPGNICCDRHSLGEMFLLSCLKMPSATEESDPLMPFDESGLQPYMSLALHYESVIGGLQVKGRNHQPL